MPKLTFLGVGSAFHPELHNTSACFWQNDTLYLLDCGSTVVSRLLYTGMLQSAKRLVVLISHLHADHTGSLGTLLAYCRHVRPISVTLVHPQDNLCALMELSGIPRDRYVFCSGLDYADDAICARFFPVPHTGALAAFGMTVSDGPETIYFSGDAAKIPDEVWSRFLTGDIARIYQDAALHSDPKAHGTYSVFLTICPAERRAAFFPIHWDEDMAARIQDDGFGLVDLSQNNT